MVSGPGGNDQVGWGPQDSQEPQHQGAWTPALAHEPPSQAPGSKLTQDTLPRLFQQERS